MLPAPMVPYETLPGLALLAATTSLNDLYGWATLATSAMPPVPIIISGVRSFSVSKGRPGISDGLTACVSNTTPIV